MDYDPDQHPIRHAFASYRRWIVPLTMFAPTAILINMLALIGMGGGTLRSYLPTGVVLSSLAIAVCVATVWFTTAPDNSVKSRVGLCLSTCVIILYGNFLLMAIVLGIAWLAGGRI